MGKESLSTEQIKKLMVAVKEFAIDVQASGTLLQNAAALCMQEMQSDDLSVHYAGALQKLLEDLAQQVFPPLNQLVDDLSAEAARIERITTENL